MINASHIVSAFYGVERVMGGTHPRARLFDYAGERSSRACPSHTF